LEGELLGYIDCDAHVIENDETWDFLEATDRRYRPMTLVAEGDKHRTAYWALLDQRVVRSDRSANSAEYERFYPPGTTTLQDVAGRLRKMDEAGVDVQILIPTMFLTMEFGDPTVDAALSRAYNRWLIDRTKHHQDRLRWIVKPVLGMMPLALEELEIGKENGAVGVAVTRTDELPHVNNPYYWPLYERAQELGMTVVFHKAGNSRIHQLSGGPETMWSVSGSVAEAFISVAGSELSARFPDLNWAFLEIGSMWVPFALQEICRTNKRLMRRTDRDWRQETSFLRDHKLFVSCQVDDDVPYVLRYAGEDNLVVGSDWSHYDRGSDPDAHAAMVRRGDLDDGVLAKLLDANGRRLFGLDASADLRSPTAQATVTA
jgi:predicted TIM-barrel fold metal-dependent hydrolase